MLNKKIRKTLLACERFWGKFEINCIVLLFIILFTNPGNAQTKQKVLEERFPNGYVETFDQLDDWHGLLGSLSDGDVTEPGDMPQKTGNGSSIWGFYSYWGETPGAQRPDWIKDHGVTNVWRGPGKSLCIDYNGDKGPSRMGFHIGTQPSDGYNEFYIFFMNKYNKAFFPTNGTNFEYWGYLKTFFVATGFRSIGHWGTTDEQENADNTPQVRNIFGLNYTLINWKTDQSKILPQFNIYCSNPEGTNSVVSVEHNSNTGCKLPVVNDEWFGVEYHFRISNPHGSETGILEIWAYDKQGNKICYERMENINNFNDATDLPHYFDHKYNKFVWGGNRSEQNFTEEGNATESHCYIDDIIVNDQRIGPTYFEVIFAGQDTSILPPELYIIRY